MEDDTTDRIPRMMSWFALWRSNSFLNSSVVVGCISGVKKDGLDTAGMLSKNVHDVDVYRIQFYRSDSDLIVTIQI